MSKQAGQLRRGYKPATIRELHKIDDVFVPLTSERLESVAFRALSLNARQVLDALERVYLKTGGTGNGSLACPYDEFAQLKPDKGQGSQPTKRKKQAGIGIRRQSIRLAIEEAEFFGFVRRVSTGYRSSVPLASTYRLTYLPCEGDMTKPSDEWRAVTPDHLKAWRELKRARRQRKRRKAFVGKAAPPRIIDWPVNVIDLETAKRGVQ